RARVPGPDADQAVHGDHPQFVWSLRLPVHRLHPDHDRCVLLGAVPVLVESVRAVLLADQRQSERHAGVLLPRQLPRPPGDGSDIIYHEYTHGLSHRLVVDANGDSTLGFVQAGAMGEAWSDWYALDYLADRGLRRDTAAPGEMLIGQYVDHGGTIRSEPTDC